MIETVVSSSVLILLVLAIRKIFKGKIKLWIQYSLWLLVLIRLMLPFSIGKSAVSIMNYITLPQETSTDLVTAGQGSYNFGTYDDKSSGSNNSQISELQISNDLSKISEAQTESKISKTSTGIKTPYILKQIWHIGIAVILLYMAILNSVFAINLMKKREKLVYDCILPVYVCNGLSSPCLFLWFNGAAIYVIPEAVENKEKLGYVIAHELTHFYHMDWLWTIFRNVILAVYWFNPLVWIAAFVSRQDCEMVCDEATLRRIGEDKFADYGKTLISLIPVKKKPKTVFYALTAMRGGKKNMKERITMIAKRPKMLISTLIVLIIITAGAVGCTFTSAKPGHKPDEKDPALTIEEIIAKYKQNDAIIKSIHYIGDDHVLIEYEYPGSSNFFDLYCLSTGDMDSLPKGDYYVTLKEIVSENEIILFTEGKHSESSIEGSPFVIRCIREQNDTQSIDDFKATYEDAYLSLDYSIEIGSKAEENISQIKATEDSLQVYFVPVEGNEVAFFADATDTAPTKTSYDKDKNQFVLEIQCEGLAEGVKEGKTDVSDNPYVSSYELSARNGKFYITIDLKDNVTGYVIKKCREDEMLDIIYLEISFGTK